MYRRTSYEDDEDEDINAPPEKIREAIKKNDIGDLLDLDWSEPSIQEPSTNAASPSAHNPLDDLLSLNTTTTTTSPVQPTTTKNDIMDLFGTSMSPNSHSQATPPPPSSTTPAKNDPFADLF